jgi:hypothetical protein
MKTVTRAPEGQPAMQNKIVNVGISSTNRANPFASVRAIKSVRHRSPFLENPNRVGTDYEDHSALEWYLSVPLCMQ